ncbi:MAG: FlgD immunoglobulin-like domain containing protein [Armatimonadota bacterium]
MSASGSTDPDGDAVSYRYRWYRDGALQSAYNDATSVPSLATAKGQTWRCVVTPTDGTADGPSAQDEVTIANSAPSAPSVDVTPDSPKTTDALSVSASGSTDPDGDTVSYRYRWYRDGALQSAYNDATSIPSSATAKGQTWRCVVTPSDGTADGPSAQDEVTIANSPPSAPTVNVTPDSPKTTDALSVSASGSTDPDGDAVSYRYRWYRDGALQSAHNDATTIPSSATAKGQTWRCVVTPSDSTADGPSAQDEVTIANSPPSAPTVNVTPDSPKTTDALSVSASGSTDPDGDTVKYRYRWYCDGVMLSAYNGATTVPALATTKGQTWRCSVRAYDGSTYGAEGTDQVVIQNSPPTAACVVISPAHPALGDNLTVTASGAQDTDGDPVTYRYRWYRDGAVQSAYNDVTTIPSSATAKGQTWRCVVTPTDGTADGPSAQDEVTIANSPPSAPTVNVTPDSPKTTDALSVSASGSTDPDGDAVSYRYRWYRDGALQSAYNDASSIPSSATAKGQTWRCVVTPSDGTADGPSAQDEVTIANSAPSAPTVNVTPDSPKTTDALSVSASGSTDPDGDTVSYRHRWYRDGALQSAYNDASSIPSSATAKGQTWRCVVTPTDGTADGPSAQDEVTIANSPPSAPTVNVTPDSPKTTDALSVSASGGTDPDGDAVSYRYRWYRDGQLQSGFNDQTTIPASATAAGQTWRCVVTPTDGTADGPSAQDQVTVASANRPPTAPTVNVMPDNPKTTDALSVSASGSTDPDGDAVSYRYRWYRDGALQSAYNDATSIPSSATAKGQTWRCVVTPSDGTADGPSAQDEVTIANSPPSAPAVRIVPDHPSHADDLAASVSGSDDADGDSVSYRYRWYRNGQHQVAYDDRATVPSSATSPADIWRCVVTATDGASESAISQDEVTIGNSAPAAPSVDVTPDSPKTTDALNVRVSGSDDPDGDSVSYRYRWYRDGQLQSAHNDATSVPASATAKGQTWRCVVTPTDGTTDGPSGEDSVTIANSAPTAPTVDVRPNAPRAADDLSALASGSQDADGDAVLYRYSWYRNGELQPAYNDRSSVPASATAGGETWRCVVTPFDGADTGPAVYDEVIVRDLQIVSGPSGTPDPAASGSAVRLSVQIAGATDGQLRYRWTARDQAGEEVGSFSDPTSPSPIWIAPVVPHQMRCHITVSVSWADGAGGEVTGAYDQRVVPAVKTKVDRGWSMPSVGLPIATDVPLKDLFGGRLTSLAVWNATTQRYERLNVSTAVGQLRARGMWAQARAPSEATILVEALNEVTVPVARGWNLLANPFPVAISVTTDILPAGGQLVPPAFRWTEGGYSTVEVVPPGCSFWLVAAYNGTVTFRLPQTPASPQAQSAALVRPSPEAGDGQQIQIVTEMGGCVDADTWIGIAAGDEAVRIAKPPARPGAACAYLDPSGGIGHAQSFVPAGAAGTWRLIVVSPPEAEVTLRIADTSQLGGDVALWLEDLATGARVDLRHAPGYSFSARGGERRFMLTMGERGGMVQVSSLCAQAGGAGAQVSFTLSAPASVSVEIMNVAGRTVRRLLVERECAAGSQTLSWNGRSDTGTQVPRGTYFVRVNATTPAGYTANALAPLHLR